MVEIPSDEERARAASVGMGPSLWARALPDAPAVLSPSGDRTFGELNANANRLARALRARGLATGDSVALVCSNRPQFAEVVQACMRAGLRYTPINRHLAADEMAYIVGDCEARALIGDGRHAEVMEEVTKLSADATVRLAIGGEIAGYEDYAAALAEQSGDDLDDPHLGQRMLYTSGTTGRPKGVVRPPIYTTGLASTGAAGYAPDEGQLHLCTGPLYHGAPLSFSLLLPLSAGVGVVLMERWDAQQALELIAKHRITHTHMVPTMFHRMLRLPAELRRGADISSMQYILHGAAPCPVATKQAMFDWFGPIIWEYFAATEGAGSSVGPEQWLERPGTVGKPPTADHVRIVDDEGNPCPPNRPGTIELKAVAGAEFSYFKDPEKTADARHGTHFTLGDVGYLDEDGFLFLTDRSANLIISGGVNIYPAEVEAVLIEHTAVVDVAVFGIPDAEWGEAVKAVVQLAPEATGGPDLEREILDWAREQIAKFKIPRTIDFVTELPRLPTGKLYKRKLRDPYWEGHERRI